MKLYFRKYFKIMKWATKYKLLFLIILFFNACTHQKKKLNSTTSKDSTDLHLLVKLKKNIGKDSINLIHAMAKHYHCGGVSWNTVKTDINLNVVELGLYFFIDTLKIPKEIYNFKNLRVLKLHTEQEILFQNLPNSIKFLKLIIPTTSKRKIINVKNCKVDTLQIITNKFQEVYVHSLREKYFLDICKADFCR